MIPAKANVEEQADFLATKLQPRLQQAEAGKRTVLFVDAAHFVYGPFLGFVWCLVRLFVPAPSGRKRYNVLAALDAITHRVIRVSNDGYINAESVCQLLRQIAAAGLRRPITLVLDNARYQHCALVQGLARSLKIELLFLPSYSPNLNLIERLWKFVKKECLASKYLPTYADFTAALDDCLNNLHTRHKVKMDTLLGERQKLIYQRFSHRLDGDVVFGQRRRTTQSSFVLLHFLARNANAVGIVAVLPLHGGVQALPGHP